MKKNKLFTILAAATMLVGTGSTVSLNNNATVQAATKKKTTKKSAKKATLKRYPVTFKRAPKTYYEAVEVKSNGKTYTKIAKYKNKQLKFKKGSKTTVFYSLTVNSGAKYYFLGTVTTGKGKKAKLHSVFVKSSDLKIKNKKIPNYGKKAKPQAQKPQKAEVTVNIPKYDKIWKGTINKDTDQIIAVQDVNGKSTVAQYKDANGKPVTWNKGKEVNVYATEDLTATSKEDPSKTQTIKTYMILIPGNDNKNQILFVPTEYIDLEDKNAQVSTMAQFNTDYKTYEENVNKLIEQAKADAQKKQEAAKKAQNKKKSTKKSKKANKKTSKKANKKTSKKANKKTSKKAKKSKKNKKAKKATKKVKKATKANK